MYIIHEYAYIHNIDSYIHTIISLCVINVTKCLSHWVEPELAVKMSPHATFS